MTVWGLFDIEEVGTPIGTAEIKLLVSLHASEESAQRAAVEHAGPDWAIQRWTVHP